MASRPTKFFTLAIMHPVKEYNLNEIIYFQVNGYYAGKAQLPGLYANIEKIATQASDGVSVCMDKVFAKAADKFAETQKNLSSTGSTPVATISPAASIAPFSPIAPISPIV